MGRTKYVESDHEKRMIRDFLKELGKHDEYYLKVLRLRRQLDSNNITYLQLAEFMDTEESLVKKFFIGKGRKSHSVPRVADFEHAIESYLDTKEAGGYLGRKWWPPIKSEYDIHED